MAEVIAEQMTDAFKRQMEKQPQGDAPSANRAVPNAMVDYDSEDVERFDLFLNAEDNGDAHWVTMSGQPKLIKGDGEIIGGTKPLHQRCVDAKAAYEKNANHPSADDVVSGKINIDSALEKGFEAEVGGYMITFYTKEILGDHYEDREGRINVIPKMLAIRNKLQNRGYRKGKRVFYPEKPTTDDGRKHVLIIDDATGMAISVMKADDIYIHKHFASWKRHNK